MLHGIGGCTIAEAKERLSIDEALSWFAYIRKRGTLNWGLRLEAGFGMLAVQVNRAVGGKAELKDFTRHLVDEEPDAVATDADIIALMGVRRKN